MAELTERFVIDTTIRTFEGGPLDWQGKVNDFLRDRTYIDLKIGKNFCVLVYKNVPDVS